MLVPDGLAATTEGVEELNQLLGGHAAAVVGDDPSIHSEILDGLPFDAVLDPRSAGLKGVDQRLTRPLEVPALAVDPLDEVLRACRLHRQDTGRVAHDHLGLLSQAPLENVG